ncbi:MAG: sigma-54-dependent transcriptional regulator, partial [Acidobacteriota bacterium]
MARVLIIDDDRAMGQMLAGLVARMGHEARCVLTLKDGLLESGRADYDVVFLDVNLPDGSGLDALPEIVKAPSSPEVIIMTGYGDPDGAEIAIESGAWDYLQKPLSPKKIMLPLTRVFQYRDNLKKRSALPMTLNLDGIIGNSPRMKACYALVAQAACGNANVLITGETGTGKELFARAIHQNSERVRNGLVVVDCAALPETLVESSLFGYERGAFTGADRAKHGLIRQADQGTLFLDEVGELSPSMQKSFLRVLQERCFRPVGGKQEVRSDFRLISATNRNLDRMVDESIFRKDLLFRLRSIHIGLPPLREHPEDVGELVFYHMSRL